MLEVEVIETRKKKLKVDHPDTLASMNNLAFIWKGQGRDIEAIRLISECVRLSRHILGASHPHYMSFSKTLVGWEAAGEGWLLDLGWLIMFILFSFIF